MYRKRSKISNAPRIQVTIPIVCIGNLVVGGSGKTPLLGMLTVALKRAGLAPGIVSRGYGGKVTDLPIEVEQGSDPYRVGDEPLMLKQQTECPVVVCRNRSRAVELLCLHHDLDVILADDGLQNSQFWRDLSVVVFNKNQGIGNGLEIPFGPLREPIDVLDQMDAIVVRDTAYPREMLIEMGIETKTKVFSSESCMAYAYRSDTPTIRRPLGSLASLGRFDAIAGIANPDIFFEGLTDAGLSINKHRFTDHHHYDLKDIQELSLIITTEKDAVKLIQLGINPFWVVALESQQPEFENFLIKFLQNWSKV